MAQQKSIPIITSQTCDDFDQFKAVAQQWDINFKQLDAGSFRSHIIQYNSNTMHITKASLNRSFEQAGSTPMGMRTFAILTAQSSWIWWRGYQIGHNDVMVFPKSCELDAVSPAGFDVFTISVPNKFLEQAGVDLGLSKEVDELDQQEVARVHCPKLQRLRSCLDHVLLQSKSNALNSLKQQEMFELEVQRLLLNCLSSKQLHDHHASSQTRRSAIERTGRYLAEKITGPVTVLDLAKNARVSVRTLEYAFLEYFGLTPKAYIKISRLNHVHHALKHADLSRVKISHIANHWGFWHMGQFACDYRNMFGELPSQTLKKNN